MELAGQATVPRVPRAAGKRLDDDGFVMVVLLVSMAVTAVWMAAALPAWRQQAQREKEAELVFRGEAIARAVYLYRQENGQTLPPNIDTLVAQRFLRKKYVDPITGKDFLPVAGAMAAPGGSFGAQQGGIIGVRSTSNDPSIRVYNNQQTYSQFAFDFTLEQLRSGGGTPSLGPMVPVPDGRGRTGGGVGNRRGGPGGGLRGGGINGGSGARAGRGGIQQPD
jgi:type II secretory pathway pseudopilin PulG